MSWNDLDFAFNAYADGKFLMLFLLEIN